MLCERCGKQVEKDAVYCPHCGARMGADAKFSAYDQYEHGKIGESTKSIILLFGGLGVLLVVIVALCIVFISGLTDNKSDPQKEKQAQEVEDNDDEGEIAAISQEEEETPAPIQINTPVATPVESSVVTTPILEETPAVAVDASVTPVVSPEDTDIYIYEGDYICPEISNTYLSEETVASWDVLTMYLARNEIYAKKGVIFRHEDLNAYFGGKSWYNGTVFIGDFSGEGINQYEEANAELIKKYEKLKGSIYID